MPITFLNLDKTVLLQLELGTTAELTVPKLFVAERCSDVLLRISADLERRAIDASVVLVKEVEIGRSVPIKIVPNNSLSPREITTLDKLSGIRGH